MKAGQNLSISDTIETPLNRQPWSLAPSSGKFHGKYTNNNSTSVVWNFAMKFPDKTGHTTPLHIFLWDRLRVLGFVSFNFTCHLRNRLTCYLLIFGVCSQLPAHFFFPAGLEMWGVISTGELSHYYTPRDCQHSLRGCSAYF